MWDRYWAAEPPEECAKAVVDKINTFRDNLKKSQLWPRYIRSFRNWHGLGDQHSGEVSTLSRRGNRGQRASVRTSTAAIDARHQLGLIAPVIPALDAIPINTAYKTLAQVPESKRFFDYFVERRGLGRIFYKTAEYCLQFGIAWCVTDWDVFGGPLLEQGNQQTGQPLLGPDGQPIKPRHQGELKFRAHNPLDNVIDFHQDGHHDWFISRDKVNRWKLIEDYPALKAELLNADSVLQDDEWSSSNFRFDSLSKDRYLTDLIPIWTLHHRRASPLPNGRLFRIVNDKCWLFDGPYPYDELTIAEMNAGKIWNTAMGDSTYHHALGVQAGLDRVLSAMATNALALGHQFVNIPDENFELKELSDGVSAIVRGTLPGSGPPSGVSLLGPQNEHIQVIEVMEKYIHAATAINSVIRGDPDTNIKSGSYAGLLVQQAAQFNSPMQYSFSHELVEPTGNFMLDILKKFADQPILGEIAGPSGQWRMRVWSQEDYQGIHRLVVRQGDPSEQTPAFRKAKADTLLENKLIESAEQYDAMVEGNTTELATEDKDAEELLMLLENETMQALAEGKPLEPYMVAVPLPPELQPKGPDGLPLPPQIGPDGLPMPPMLVPPVLLTHNDVLHVRKHATFANSPAASGNPKLVQINGAHIQWHLFNAQTKPPELAMMLGQPVLPPPVDPNAPQQGGPPKNGKPPAEKGPNGVQAVRPPKVPPEAQPQAGMGP